MSGANEHALNEMWRAPMKDPGAIQAEIEQAYAERDAHASRDRRLFARLQSMPTRTERQERALQNVVSVAELEAHFDENERQWNAQDIAPSDGCAR